jgi:hypothetical protein
MNDPKRWLEDEGVSESVRQLLRAGDPLPPVPEAAADQLAVLAQGLAAKGALTAVTGSVLGTKVILGMTVIGVAAAAGIASVAVLAPDPDPGVAATHSAAAESTASAGSVFGPNPPGSERVAASPMLAESSSVRAGGSGTSMRSGPPEQGEAVIPASPSGVPVAAFSDANMAAEARLLERARMVLPVDPGAALNLTEEHLRAYPDGQLAAEREVIAIDALQRLGRGDEARRRAAPFLGKPNNAYARRVARILGDAP